MLLTAQYVLPITSEPILGGAVLVQDGAITDVGSADQLRRRYPAEEVHDYGQAAILPGFVDLHTHLENAVMRGMVPDDPYVGWLLALADKGQKMELTDWHDSAVLGGLECISSGITTVADCTHTGAAVSAVKKLGLRGVIYRDVGAADKRRVDAAMDKAAKDIEKWREETDESRTTIGIAPAAMFTCHPAMFGKVSEYARREGCPVALHLAGTREEYNFVRYGSSPFAVDAMDSKRRGYVEIPPWLPTGTTPVNYALNWDAFESDNVLAIHCIHVEDKDLRKLKEYDVSVAVCPRINAQLGMGVAPINEFARMGLRMGLGTDSPAATQSTDMLAEMRIGMLIQRAVDASTFLDAHTMLEMATIGGAQALKMDDKIGSLEVGKRADIIAVDLSGSHQNLTQNPEQAVVNSCNGADILLTMVEGKTLYEKNKWHVGVEVARNIARVIEIRGKLRA